MITAYNQTVDWNAPDVLGQIMTKIKSPLDNIINLNKETNILQKEEVILSNTKQIVDFIETVLNDINKKNINLSVHDKPEIFSIYETNENVKQLCNRDLKSEKISKPDKDWLLNFEKYIYKSIEHNEISLYELAYEMSVSERQLNRKILNLINITPNKYIRILRLHKAKQMIDNCINDSISQIAYAVGYNDSHYFTKLFYNQYNVTPKELIETIK